MTAVERARVASREQAIAIRTCIGAVLLLAGATLLPPIQLYGGQLGPMAAVHLLLELFSVVVAALVVVMAWHTIDRAGNESSNVLILVFSFVAGIDLIHALS